MTFPASDRVLYKTNPLEEVVCQLRFPPILRIDAGDVAGFQEAIRGQYPLYTEEEEVSSATGLKIPAEIAELLRMSRPGPKPAKKFSSADARWTVALARDFIALSTHDYERWEAFRLRLVAVVETLVQIYRPAFYTRVGLRYRNAVSRPKLNLSEVPWSELLQPFVSSELATEVGKSVKELNHVALITLGDRGRVRVRHGLSKPDGSGEQSYTIDADFFAEERTELQDAQQRLDDFNREAALLFRWCIKPRLHDAMGPGPL